MGYAPPEPRAAVTASRINRNHPHDYVLTRSNLGAPAAALAVTSSACVEGDAASRHDRQMAARAAEHAAQGDAASFAAVDGRLTHGQALLDRPHRPALIWIELLERGTLGVERTHVAHLGRLAAVVALEPAERKTLRAARVRAMLVDTALPAFVQECAASDLVRDARREQLGVMALDHGGFDLEDRERVGAAVVASGAACEARPVRSCDGCHELVHDAAQTLDPVDDLARDLRSRRRGRHRTRELARRDGVVERGSAD